MIILAYGVPGTGKSTLLHDLVRKQAHLHRFFVVDHEAGWARGGIHWRGAAPSNLFLIDKKTRLPPVGQLPPTGVFVFRNWEPLDVARLVVEHGDTVFVDDEIDFCARRQGWESSPLRLIVHQGRHLPNAAGEVSECHIMGACRRPQNLASDLSELASEVYIFRIQGDLTLSRLVRDDHLSDSELDMVRNLPNFQCVHFPSRRVLSLSPIGGRPRPSAQ